MSDWSHAVYEKLQKLADRHIKFAIFNHRGDIEFRLQSKDLKSLYECWSKSMEDGTEMLWKKAQELFPEKFT